LDPWIGIVLSLIAIILIYYELFVISRWLFNRNRIGFAAFLVFLSPFALALAQARTLLDLLWILLLTPFYSVVITFLLFTSWILRFYCVAFTILLLLEYTLRISHPQIQSASNAFCYDIFWKSNLKQETKTVVRKNKLLRVARGCKQHLTRALDRHWNLLVAAVLLAVLATTIVQANVDVRNPTCQEVQKFVVSDKTDQHRYIENSYTCMDFASDFRNNAVKAGFKCGIVVIFFPDYSSHALDCFNTTDKGIIFIEPQFDQTVVVAKGETYWPTVSTNPLNNSTITGYYIKW